MLGVLTGRWLQSKRPLIDQLRVLAFAGVILMLAGFAWGLVFPINKPIWSSSYVLFTGGACALLLAIIAWAVDVMRWKRWSKTFLVFGTNPIVAYVGAEFLASVLRSSIKFKLDGQRLGTGMTVVRLLEGAGVSPYVGSLVWALLFVGLCYLWLRVMYKRGIFLRV